MVLPCSGVSSAVIFSRELWELGRKARPRVDLADSHQMTQPACPYHMNSPKNVLLRHRDSGGVPSVAFAAGVLTAPLLAAGQLGAAFVTES